MKHRDHRCPKCGAWWNESRECEPCDAVTPYRIVEALKADPRRDIYEAAQPRGEYWISYQGGGPIPRATVMQMLEAGTLRRKYPEGECYTLAANDEIRHAGPDAHDKQKQRNPALPASKC